MNNLMRISGIFITGALVGAGVALAYAPNSGSGTKRELKRKYHKLKREIDRLKVVVNEQTDRLKHEMMDSATTLKNEVKQSASTVTE